MTAVTVTFSDFTITPPPPLSEVVQQMETELADLRANKANPRRIYKAMKHLERAKAGLAAGKSYLIECR